VKKERANRSPFPATAVLTALLAALFIPLRGQVVINEFSASNSSTIADPDFNDYADWLELYNAGSTTWNMKGYYVTDNLGNPDKWQIPVDAVIEPGGYLLIWADGMNTGLHASYKISAEGEELGLFNPGLGLLDSVSFTPQSADISYGRVPDGGPEWGYFREPTPGSANTTGSYPGIVYNLPTFSLRGGFYSGPQSVALSSEFGGDIRYTIDGSEPLESSDLYNAPVNVTFTTAVRARIFRAGLIPGPVITQSYFIDENSAGEKLPVVSIATDPGNFWDPVTGIYTQNFKPEWEVPVNVELFENNGLDRAAFNQRAGIKINGLYSWQLPQKMLGVYFKKAYGPGNLDYRITPQRKRNSYKNFALRASGSDWSYTLFRDVLAQHATLYNMDIDIMGFKPAVVFVNGDYLGIHNIREKVDADYIEKSYDMEPGSFDLVENQDFPEAGDLLAYEYLQDLLGNDLAVDANYNAVAELVDIENFTDMVITEMACRNTSIDHNVMCWKPKEGGKWRWVLMDLDRGFFKPASDFISFYRSQSHWILSYLWRNGGYRDYFAGRLASQLFTTFNADRMKSLIDEHEAIIEDEIPRHIDRWYGTTSSYGNAMPSEEYWRDEVCNLRRFVEERPADLLANLQGYDYPGIANLALECTPPEAGVILVEGLKTAGPFSYGPYLKEWETVIEATERPGYDFTGWYEVPRLWIIPPGSEWKYLDNGIYPGSSWVQAGFDDGSWESGPAELGYGDGDEATEIGYGGSSSNKYITSWFRKSVTIPEGLVGDGVFFLHLLKDDGAIVYLNGTEIARANIPCGDTDHQTRAITAVGAETEEVFITYLIDNDLLKAGANILAAEVHQDSPNSSDISFDLGLSCYLPDSATLYAADPRIRVNLLDDRFFTARYATNTTCFVPEIIGYDMTLSADCSPWLVLQDITIPEGVTLEIDPGVEILMPAGGSIFVQGVLNAGGDSTAPVTFRLNPEEPGDSWGGMVFRNTEGPSSLRYVTIEDASEGPDPVLENAAISAFNADLVLDHMVIGQVKSNPIVGRYSDITLTYSSLHSEVTGDLINVKYGNALIKHCRFVGNDQIDTDAIDCDGTGTAIIRSCTITGFHAFNSDAVDIGEEAAGVLVDSVVAFHVADKGVSVGQHSSATVTNSIFITCNMGVAVKDSSTAVIRNCIFYNTGNPVACYEKNIGLAGGNAWVINSILSNSSEASWMADGRSAIQISYSLSDNTPLPDGQSNLFGNPLFRRPSLFDFGLLPSSPGILSGYSAGGPVNMGTSVDADAFEPPVMISQFFVNGSSLDLPQFITLFNPSDRPAELSGYAIDKGVTVSIPAGTAIGPKGRVFLTGNAADPFWDGVISPVVEWSAGRLSENGESLRLVDPYGIVTDYLVYDDMSWPLAGFAGEEAFVLTDPSLDNHFSESWTTVNVADALGSKRLQRADGLSVYPNPTRGTIFIDHPGTGLTDVEIFNISGQLLGRFPLDPSGRTAVDLSGYGTGLYLVKAGMRVEKVVVAGPDGR
jgi:hypothetical protein